MSTASLGIKRLCAGCGARFYDLGKNPAKCPKCGVMNDATAPVKARRSRKAAAVDSDDPLVKAKAGNRMTVKPKKAVKEIEDVDLEEFEDIETLDSEEEIEELEEIEDIDSIEELEEIEGAQEKISDDDMAIEDGSDELIDEIDDMEEGEDDAEEDIKPKAGASKVKKKGKK